MMTILPDDKFRIFVSVLSLLVLSERSETLGAIRESEAIAVFINEGRTAIQINVTSGDGKDGTTLPLRPGAMERTLFSGGQVKLYTPSENMVSGRLLFARSLPTPKSAPEFMEKGTRTYYFRVVGGKIILVKPRDLTAKERKWLKERAKGGW